MESGELTGSKISTEGQAIPGTETPITRAALDEAVDKLNSTLTSLGKPVWAAISLVIIVLFAGFLTVLLTSYAIVIDSNNSKTASYEQLNMKIDSLLIKLNK